MDPTKNPQVADQAQAAIDSIQGAANQQPQTPEIEE